MAKLITEYRVGKMKQRTGSIYESSALVEQYFNSGVRKSRRPPPSRSCGFIRIPTSTTLTSRPLILKSFCAKATASGPPSFFWDAPLSTRIRGWSWPSAWPSGWAWWVPVTVIQSLRVKSSLSILSPTRRRLMPTTASGLKQISHRQRHLRLWLLRIWLKKSSNQENSSNFILQKI